MSMETRQQRTRGSTDKWFGMARIGANASLRLVFAVVVARLSGTDAFAVFVALGTIEVLATTLLSAAWITPLGSIAPRVTAGGRDAFLRAGLDRTLRASGWITLALLAGIVIAMPLAAIGAGTYLAFCASTGAWLASTATAAALATRFKSRAALRGQVGAALGPAVAVGIAHATGGDAVIAYFVGNALGHAIAVVPMRRALPRSSHPVDPALLAEFRSHGRVVLSGSIANSICTRVQPFVLAAVGGAPAVAMFGAANTLVGPARVFSGALGDVLRPRLALHRGAGGDPTRVRRALMMGIVGLGSVGGAMLVLFTFAGREIGTRVFGAGFEELGRILPWAAAFVLAAALVNVLVVAMQTVSVHGAAVATRARIGAALLSLAAVWPACSWDGARGAFIAMAVFELGFLVIAVRFLATRLGASDADVAGFEVT